MKPYYESGGITIYNANCIDLIPSLAADVLVTDPPYGVNFNGKKTKHTKKARGGYTTEDSETLGPQAVSAILPHVKRAVVFPGTHLLYEYPRPSDIGCVFCPSGAGIGKWGFTLFHPVLFYGNRKDQVLKPTSIRSFAVAGVDGHPCPKPLQWLLWLVELSSFPGEVILDPFMGSGTTLRAAKDLGRRAIGIEIEEKYCEIAVRRLAQEVLFTV